MAQLEKITPISPVKHIEALIRAWEIQHKEAHENIIATARLIIDRAEEWGVTDCVPLDVYAIAAQDLETT